MRDSNGFVRFMTVMALWDVFAAILVASSVGCVAA